MKTVLITGATGFIGHYLVKEFLPDHKVICLVRHTSDYERLADVLSQVWFVEHDIRDNYDKVLDHLGGVDIILHAAGNPSAESSINDPVSVVLDNVIGTARILELARKLKVERFVYYGAGEVFGPVPKYTESGPNDRFNCVSPYAASKAGGEELCVAYANTWGVPISILHITNTFGPMSQSNRYPVILIKKLLAKETIDIHVGTDAEISGRRWLYAGDVASHTRFILEHQKELCEKWNSAGPEFITNMCLAKTVARILDQDLVYSLVPVDRPGHDANYSLCPTKLYNAGWTTPISTFERLQETVAWYKANPKWLVK